MSDDPVLSAEEEFGIKWWPVRFGIRVISEEDDLGWAVWGPHHDPRRVLAAVIRDARESGVLDELREVFSLRDLRAGITQRWANHPDENDECLLWKWCEPTAPGAVAITQIDPVARLWRKPV
ncbi:hypothetical protein ACIBJI_40200 [Nocardia sp. NPDC050408]|uniref:hypothetical protein n=1 Tax=Nocardia sp. NPDC050408 TaxID=3364319 RepID=UPI00379EA88C